ncbi:Multi antimicrobial extrusion protein [Trema orientale]|uniref:Protein DETOXIFICATION n=1 Tax=Trema orientale TaxID=63057 RepID=A0A2P5BNB2_TREOI|nr:Multi antimicrobial extrusion protein [Trema orientale]
MEEALSIEGIERKWRVTWSDLREELKKVTYLAAPMLVGSVSRFLVPVASVMIAGHLGKLTLSGIAIANSFTTITGFSLLVGMAGALESLCGQAYGAEQYQKLGIYTYCSVISLSLVCLAVSLLWIFEEKLLILIGQDPSVSKIAGKYSILLIPALLAYSIVQSLIRYLNTQGLTFATLLSSFAVLCFHIPVCWALVYKLELGITGAALSVGLSHWLNVIMLLTYIKYSSACERTRVTFSLEVLQSIREFFRFGVPAAVMACLGSLSVEMIILLSGFLPNSKLETSVLSICLITTSLHYCISYGVATAASTRVSNESELGMHGRLKQLSDKEVIKHVARLSPLVSLTIIMDSLRATLSVDEVFLSSQGIARGSGWQCLGAYVNLVAYYMVGLPLAVVLCFVLHLRGVGLWIGILAGSTTQALLFALKISFTNWRKQAIKARERIFKRTRAAESRGST